MFSIPWRSNNVGERETMTWVEWVRAIGRAAGWDGEVVILPRDRLPEHLVPDEDMGQHLVVDTARIREELGYREHVSREEGLRQTIAWERAHPPGKVGPARFDYAAEDGALAAWNKVQR